MTITIQEKVENFGWAGKAYCSEEQYEKMSPNRAWGASGVVFVIENGVFTRYYAEEGNQYCWEAKVVAQLVGQGFEISLSLKAIALRQEKARAEYEARQTEHFAACKAEAATTGRPVVVSDADYQTTASTGTNYWLVFPDGKTDTVTVGNPTGSASTRRGTTDSRPEVAEAIQRYRDAAKL